MEVKGKILEISQTQQISAAFKKREFVLEFAENPQYPEFVKFELIQDKCELLDKYKVEQTVNVAFNLKGRKWTDAQGQVKYFNSLQAWKISDEGQAPSQPSGNGNTPPPPAATDEPDWLNSDSSDDLPF
ncbi:MAG: hypothetical protein ACJAS3_002388 [Roseivirga sp.]|jgi:hypothetical protein